MNMNPSYVNEPIEESWMLAQAWAEESCPNCAWYHGFWQYLRLLGIGKTLSGQSSWFVEQIRAVGLRQEQPISILISGCADYSAFAHVIHALNLTQCDPLIHPRIIAVDQCETPLRLNQFLSKRTGVAVEGVSADVLSFIPNERFDLVFTSSFLGYFNPQERQKLFRHYHHLLKPKGRLVFTNRLRTGDEFVATVSSPDTISRTLSSALNLHRALTIDNKMNEAMFADRLTKFMQHSVHYPINSAKSLSIYLNEAGFSQHSITQRKPDLPPSAASVQLAGASLAEDAPYLCAVAERGV